MFRVLLNPLRQIVHIPALLADDHEIDIHAARPELFHRSERLPMALARFNGANHQEAGTAAQLLESLRRILRQPSRRHAGLQVSAQMKEAKRQRLEPLRLCPGEPFMNLIGNRA